MSSGNEASVALKKALQHAKELFESGLVDETEFKDLRRHELLKYKQSQSFTSSETEDEGKVETVTPTSSVGSKDAPGLQKSIDVPRDKESRDAEESKHQAKKEKTVELKEDITASRVTIVPSEDSGYSTPPSQIRRFAAFAKYKTPGGAMSSIRKRSHAKEHDILEKLTTPPIFKRRSKLHRRVIILPSKDIASL